MCKSFVVPGNEQAFLVIPVINILNITHINCNTIDAQETDRGYNCSTNTAICQGSRHKQHYTHLMQEADRAGKYYANTDSISKFYIKDKPMVIDKEHNRLFPLQSKP